MEEDVRRILLEVLDLLLENQKQARELDLRSRALGIVLAQAMGVDLKFAEESLEKIVEALRLKKVDEANEQLSATIEILRRGKDVKASDA